jgi:hypothetical protein
MHDTGTALGISMVPRTLSVEGTALQDRVLRPE